MKQIDSNAYYTWNVAYGGPALCEYYLRTGDQEVLPTIQQAVMMVKKDMVILMKVKSIMKVLMLVQ